MKGKFGFASAIAVLVTAAFLPGSGIGSSAAPARGANRLPDTLAAAIQARFHARPIGFLARPPAHPEMGLRVAVSADGTTALVGAPGAGGGSGAVYVYHVASAGSWTSTSTPAATLKAPAPDGFFGGRVVLSADGTTAVVGA